MVYLMYFWTVLDLVTVPYTANFHMFVERLKKAVGERMKARLFIIPNLNDGRIGKRSELLIRDNARDSFSNYGSHSEDFQTCRSVP